MIEDAAMLDAPLAVDVASLGAAPPPSAVRAGPKRFPVVLAPPAPAPPLECTVDVVRT